MIVELTSPLLFVCLSCSVIEEIDERHQFLDSMRAMGDLSHEPVIKAEIAHRLRDLKKLEAIMSESDDAPAAATALR
jgi:hypothetical protein